MNARRLEKGYHGQVRLRSPEGTQFVTIQVPHRQVVEANQRPGYYVPETRGQIRRQDKRFRRLLSEGWTVVKPDEEGTAGEEEKKNTSLVIGSTKSGDKSHGGDHASGEVEDSPNAAKDGKEPKRPRGCRGGQRKPNERQNTPQAKRNRRAERGAQVRVQNSGQKGSCGVYSPQPLRVGPEMLRSAEKSAELLAELVGRAGIKVKRGVTVDAERLLVALETGDNPLPPLEWPSERPKCRVLITPDCSGSTQGWSGTGKAWAMHLSKNPELEVVYLDNSNGDFWEVRGEQVERLLASVDIVVYLGDGDGHSLCTSYAQQGATVLALDCYAACVARPRLKAERFGQGQLFWVDRVSAQAPDTWATALSLALEACQ